VKNARFIPRKEIQDHLIRPWALDFDPATAREHLLESPDDRIIICEELLLASVRSGGFNGFVIKDIARRLKDVFPDARIVIFIRNQLDLIASAYGQYIKDGGRSDIDEYLYHPKAKFYVGLSQFSFRYLEFDRILDYYKDLFGERVFVFPFERFVEDRYGFLKDYSTSLNLDIDAGALDHSELNKRLNAPSYTKWRNRLRIPRGFSISRITGKRITHETVFRKRRSARDILGSKNTEYIMEYYSKPNQRLISIHGMEEIADYGYPLKH
jgi:hypothetical protein